MKKIIAFGFMILSLMSVDLSAVQIRNVVDNGNGEYTIQRTSRGVDHTFHRAVDGSWTELASDGRDLGCVSVSIARTLNAALESYILGKNTSQQKLTEHPAPAPAPEDGQGGDEGSVVSDDELEAQVNGETGDFDAAELELGVVNAGVGPEDDQLNGISAKRKKPSEDADLAEVGMLAYQLGLAPQPVPVVAVAPVQEVAPEAPAPALASAAAVEPQQPAPQVPVIVQPVQQPEFDWASRTQALEDYMRKNKRKENCLVM